MAEFIEWRKRLKIVGDVDNWVATVNQRNKEVWCENHLVSEFIEVDEYVDEFGENEVWK